MKIKPIHGHLVAEIEVDNTLLKEKLKLLTDIQSIFFGEVDDNSLSIMLYSLVNDRNVFFVSFHTVKSEDESDKNICVLDIDIASFFRKWIDTMNKTGESK